MATKNEIRDRAAQDLGILRINQSLQAQDDTRIQSAFDEVYADLRKDGLATWPSTGSSPDEITPHVVALVADNCLNTYSVSNDRYIRIKNAAGPLGKGEVAKAEIRRLITTDFVSFDNATDF